MVWVGKHLKPHPGAKKISEHLPDSLNLQVPFLQHKPSLTPFSWRADEFPASVADPSPSLPGRGYGCSVPGAAAPPVPLFHPDELPAAAAAPRGQFPAPDPPSAAELGAAEGPPAAPSVCHGTFHHPPVTSREPEPALHGDRHQLGEFGKGFPRGRAGNVQGRVGNQLGQPRHHEDFKGGSSKLGMVLVECAFECFLEENLR